MKEDVPRCAKMLVVAQKGTEDLFCEHLECIISMKNVSKFGMTTKTKIVVSNLYRTFRELKTSENAYIRHFRNFVKLVAWYDNEWGFSCKMLDLTRHIDSVRKA